MGIPIPESRLRQAQTDIVFDRLGLTRDIKNYKLKEIVSLSLSKRIVRVFDKLRLTLSSAGSD